MDGKTNNFYVERKIIEQKTYCDPAVALLQSQLMINERLIQMNETHLKQKRRLFFFSLGISIHSL